MAWLQNLLYSFRLSQENMPPIAQFDFEERTDTAFGTLHRPVAKVKFWSQTEQHWQQVLMLIDTGADLTILPQYMAAYIGLDWDREKSFTSAGVGGSFEIKVIPEVEISIGSEKRTIPIGVTSQRIPPLLGRRQALETFKMCLDHQKQVRFWP